jgi:energy-coupling factor transporter transmembrane protein EcfT
MTDSSRSQGIAICAAALVLGLVFGIGLLSGAWWAVAIPVALLLAFVLGLTFWVGYTLATVVVEPEADAGAPRPPAAQAAPEPGEGRRDEGGAPGAAGP